MRRKLLAGGLLLGLLLLIPLRIGKATPDNTTEINTNGSPLHYAYSEALDRILGEPGKKYRKHFIQAATLFDVPVDVLAASVKTESDFYNRASAGPPGKVTVGLAQVTLQEWLRAGQSEKIRQLGLAKVFTANNFQSERGGHHPLYNLLCHAHSLRYYYEKFRDYPPVRQLPFDETKSPIVWLVVIAMYNGGERILSTIYDERHEASYAAEDRLINWEKIQSADLVRLIRHGRGYHADWSRNAVANHLQKVATNLHVDPPLLQSVPVDIERQTLSGKAPPPPNSRLMAW